MKRFPKSKLQLLEPASNKDLIEENGFGGMQQNEYTSMNIINHFAYQGIHDSRVQFVKRVSKKEHIHR